MSHNKILHSIVIHWLMTCIVALAVMPVMRIGHHVTFFGNKVQIYRPLGPVSSGLAEPCSNAGDLLPISYQLSILTFMVRRNRTVTRQKMTVMDKFGQGCSAVT
ncbi:hypothetical protein BDR03DRAFT_960695 [Suillus americanus]|nr:hypothetical protein BDR03DRAFT_960695 [Suillus americanus]